MEMTTLGPIMPGMSDTEIINGHAPAIAPSALPVQYAISREQAGAHVPAGEKRKKAKRKRDWDQAFTTLLTVIAVVIAQVTSAQAMWRFTDDQLHLESIGARASTFAIFEVAMLACAWRARRTRIRKGTSSLAEKAVWVIAVTIGLLLASDETSIPAAIARFAAPILAAFLFEQLILDHAAEAEAARTGTPRTKGTWRISPTRILVKLGLRDPIARDVADVDLTRAMSRLATLRYEADLVDAKGRAKALRRYQRAVAKANEEYNLATHPTAMDKFMASLALLHGAVDNSTAEAVAPASPWVRATNRAERELNGAPPRSRASQPARASQPSRVTDNVQGPRPHNPGHDREVVKTPTVKVGRTAEENWTLIGEHLADNPQASRTELARVLDISRTRVGQIFDQFQPKAAAREDTS